MRPERSDVRRRHRAVPLALAGVALAGAAASTGLASTLTRPVVRKLSITPTSLHAAGGNVTITVRGSHATACIITSSPGIRGLPRALPCARGSASLSLTVPANVTAFTRRFHIAAHAAKAGVASASSYHWLTQGPSPMPRILTCLMRPEIRPSSYIIACGDGNAYWQGVKWTGWGGTTTTGTGQYVGNDCIPDCADGTFHAYPLTIVLSHLVRTSRYGPLYAQARFTYLIDGSVQSYTDPLPT